MTTESLTSAPGVASHVLLACFCKSCGKDLEMLASPANAAKAKCDACKKAARKAYEQRPDRKVKHKQRQAQWVAENKELKRAMDRRYKASKPKLDEDTKRAAWTKNLLKAQTPEARSKMAATLRTKGYWKNSINQLIAASKSQSAINSRINGIRNSEKAKNAARMQSAVSLPLAQAAAAASKLCQPGPKNRHSKRWIIRSPMRIVYDFVCLAEFIRQNPGLFDAEDIIWKNHICRALKGLSSIRPDRKGRVLGSWKGWQWVSHKERIYGNNDLLGMTPHS